MRTYYIKANKTIRREQNNSKTKHETGNKESHSKSNITADSGYCKKLNQVPESKLVCW